MHSRRSVQGFLAWLARRRPTVRELQAALRRYPHLAPFALPDPPLPRLASLQLSAMELGRSQLQSLAANTRLTRLELAECAVEQLPRSFRGLSRLQALAFRGEQLSPELPTGLHQLSALLALTSLELETRFDVSLPPARLAHLEVSDCVEASGLHQGWQQVASLAALTELRVAANLALANCRLTQVPAALAAMPALRELSLQRNSLAGGWGRLSALQQLTRLDLQGCDLQRVPAALGSACPALLELSLYGNRGLAAAGAWRRVAPPPQLSSLDLGFCYLTSVAPLSRLTALRALYLGATTTAQPAGSSWPSCRASASSSCKLQITQRQARMTQAAGGRRAGSASAAAAAEVAAVEALLARFPERPKCIVFDLDYTLWPFWCEMFSRGDTPWLYPDVPAILRGLGAASIDLAVASRTPTPHVADAFLDKLQLRSHFCSIQLIPAADGFDHHSAQKDRAHLPCIQQETGHAYTDMLFFDDEHGNIRKVSRLGVVSILVDTATGVSLAALEQGLRAFADAKRASAGSTSKQT
ncbi:hypothetical protein ABPG75_001915 [Micractinium tetrahymenae]